MGALVAMADELTVYLKLFVANIYFETWQNQLYMVVGVSIKFLKMSQKNFGHSRLLKFYSCN